MRRGLRIGVSSLAALVFVACLGRPTPRDHFFRLEIAPPTTPLARPLFPGTLEVERLGADALVRERQILRSRAGSSEVVPYGYDLWTDSPTLLIQRSLAEYLRAAGVAEQIATPSMLVEESWILSGYLSRLEQVLDSDPQVRVELELSVSQRGRGALVMQRTYRVVQPAEGDSVPEAVAAFQTALSGIFERFVADLATER